MIFGFDFDNTLINYDNIFYKLALKDQLIGKNFKRNKETIKKNLIKNKKIAEWKKLQSAVYSQEIEKAKPNRKFISIFRFLKKSKIKFYVISHKTKFPYSGKKINLHKVSRKWLNKNIFNKKNKIGKCKYYFEPSIKKKILRIKKLKITHFIDDLKIIIDMLPNNIKKIQYKNNTFKVLSIKKLIKKDLSN
tara:strand:- start:23 stop:595 length:573 start_codon:yes stop_codon:yes gene_type:complete